MTKLIENGIKMVIITIFYMLKKIRLNILRRDMENIKRQNQALRDENYYV